ncbi:FKBP-type peptidyl-prolyl cis-trans isomerase domain-containing protein [Tanacetum coccineum]
MEEERPDQVYKTRDWEGREIGPAVAFFLSIETHLGCVGCFCPALSRAVKTMKQRRKKLFLVLTVKPQSFTENGREPASANKFVAPPNATIQITRELFSKKVFNEGEGYDRQNDGAIVQVKLIGKLHDGTVFVNKGDNEVVDGLDRGVKTMKKGEVASLTIHPEYVFGSTELHQESVTVPANSNVYYAVDLVSFEKAAPVQLRITVDDKQVTLNELEVDDRFKESMALIKAPPYTQLECIIIYYKYQMKQWKVAAFIQFYENGIEDESGSEFRGDTYEEKEERLLLGNIEQEREWKAWGFVVLDPSSVLFFIDEKPKTAMPRWSKARTRATNVGKATIIKAEVVTDAAQDETVKWDDGLLLRLKTKLGTRLLE